MRIGNGEAVLTGRVGKTRGPISGLDASLEHLLWEQQRAYRMPDGLILRDGEGRGIESVLDQLGQKLGDAFLPKEVAAQLQADIDDAVRHNATLELALDLADGLADLPWEGLRLPGVTGQPLALHSRVDLYRHVALEGPSSTISIAGPLRILVAIGSPEAQNARGEILDMERELRIILDAIEPARRTGRAMIRVLERGSVAAIGDALRQQRYHVLYVSCHAVPGRLILEDAAGAEDEVTVARFWEEALPADHGVPLMVLAGCSTARAELPGKDATEPLPGFARGLVARGVPAVIAMQAPVSDVYATDLAGELFEALATWQHPEPLRALAYARRELERQRLAVPSPQQKPPEWPTPTFYARGAPLPLYDPTADFEKLAPDPAPPRLKGVVVRQVGDFVGRRGEERLMLKHLRAADGTGMLLHGIGGVGKSSLAANVLHRLAMDGWLLASWSGAVDCDQVLDQIGRRLFDFCLSQGWNAQHPLRQLLIIVREPKVDWDERLDLLDQHVFAQLPMVFLLDNFEDNLDEQRWVRGDLANLLARWVEQPGKSRLVFTCRYPFQLPNDTAARLDDLHLGPLSPAETRKLMLRLPGLGALQPKELQRAYEEVGGHPRALEYLDALLRGGEARCKDVEKRLKKALKARGVRDASKWRLDTEGGLDAALAETATLAADDVLLDELLRQLEPALLARRLVLGAAVYRVPVDRVGLAYQVGNVVERPVDPERQQRMARVNKAFEGAKGPGPHLAAFGLSEADMRHFMRDMLAVTGPPADERESFDEAVALLESLSLLSPVQYTDDGIPRYFVHRWTALALARLSSPDALADAHRRAARYWRWRIDSLKEPRQQAIQNLLEARHHYYAAGELDEAIAVHENACAALDVIGAWQREERLIHELLSWLPERSPKAATHFLQLGKIAYSRGDSDQALNWFRKSLEIAKPLGNRVGIAACYNELGLVEYMRVNYREALKWHRKSLNVSEALGSRAGMAASYHNLAIVTREGGDYDQAFKWCNKSLEIEKILGNKLGIATSYHELGNLAYLRGEHDQALDWCRKSLEIRQSVGDYAGVASSLHQWGDLALASGDYNQALHWFRESLNISQALGDRAQVARSYGRLGVLYLKRGDAEEAVPFSVRSLTLALEIRSPEAGGNLYWLRLQREALGVERFGQILREHLDEESATLVLKLLHD